ncbi:hypothetical protein LCGC14_0410150 [marine sediment metagenome]|uniref:Uncharacterized protein n=1 Tax=marine sediment metagenome TaxID=412755 RepID=A0A0F9VG58_9ZZZZ
MARTKKRLYSPLDIDMLEEMGSLYLEIGAYRRFRNRVGGTPDAAAFKASVEYEELQT